MGRGCTHQRLVRTGRIKWGGGKGRRTLHCLDCGKFWLWNRAGNYYEGAGFCGGAMHAKLEKRKARLQAKGL